ncbi:hypothetical protein ACMA1I_15605 [Pontibacter sp. 13R65]|uniref:hypothetical protein n=1 Tax=Pontibacter sp. 13R65 TaxID=3127458 RepID=UPI00301C15D7
MNFLLRAIILLLILTITNRKGYGQSGSHQTESGPVGGAAKLGLTYYKIDFTKEQRKLLQDKEIELTFLVDTSGVATLEDIKGVTDKAIRDSLQNASQKLPIFEPYTVNGEKESALYFLKFQLPKYRVADEQTAMQSMLTYNEASYEDFEYIHKSGERLDLLLGGVANTFLGSPGSYLHPGGGMKVDVMYRGRTGIGGGLIMSFYGNKLKQDYPILSGREQNPAPPTLLIGIGLNKTILKKERSESMLQAELALASQNITPRLGNEDEDWTQLKGFSPGLVGNYLIQFGKNRMYYAYGSPSIYSHYLNLHGAIRPVFLDLKQATGVMLELGVSYRFGAHIVEEYRLKPRSGQ